MQLFNDGVPQLKSPYMLNRKGEVPSLFDRIKRMWRFGSFAAYVQEITPAVREGTLCDMDILKECCRENMGDMTFLVRTLHAACVVWPLTASRKPTRKPGASSMCPSTPHTRSVHRGV